MHLPTLLAVASFAATASAQISTVSVNDVGLTMRTGSLTSTTGALAGQRCGPFTCTPFSSPLSTTASLVRTVSVYGDAGSLFVLFMSTGPAFSPCLPIPGLGNALILGQPLAALTIGAIGPYLPGTSVTCHQGVATYQLTLPPVAPSVIPFHLQAVTYSFQTQAPAFTVAVRGLAH